MAGANILVPSVESSTCKSAPSVRYYYCNIVRKYTIALIVLLSVRNTHTQYAGEHLYQTSLIQPKYLSCLTNQ